MLQGKPLYTHLLTSPLFFFGRVKDLVIHPTFIVLTLLGNGFMVFSAVVFFFVEKGENPKVATYLDALWWAVSTVTSVGYGDIVPITVAGKWVGMMTMIVGTAIFTSFTALFAATLLRSEK